MKIVNGFDQGGEECTRCGLLYCWVQRDALQVLAMLEAGLAYIVYLGMRSTGWMVWTSERYMEFRPPKTNKKLKLSVMSGSGCT